MGAIELATFGEITRARCVRLDRLDLGQIVYVLTELPLDARRVDLRAKSLIDIKVKLQKEVQRLGNRAAEFCSTLHKGFVLDVALKLKWERRWDYTGDPMSKKRTTWT